VELVVVVVLVLVTGGGVLGFVLAGGGSFTGTRAG
jgi:hypothetical protein